MKLKSYLLMIASGALAIAGLGSSCPGTGSKAQFDNGSLLALKGTTPTKGWHTPTFVDIGAVDLSSNNLDHNQNIKTDNVTGAKFPSIVFNDGFRSFYSVFNRGVLTPPGTPTNVYAYATQKLDFGSTGWVTGFGSFTQLDVTTAVSVDSQRPQVVVDTLGNATVVLTAQPFAGPIHRPIATVHTYGNGTAWSTPVDISSANSTDDVSTSLNVAADAFNNVVAVWATNGRALYNEYRPGLGWRFNNTGTNFVRWDDTTATVEDYGISVGFDSNGNGWGAYMVQNGVANQDHKLRVARWRGNTTSNFPLLPGGDYQDIDAFSCVLNGICGFPKLWVAPDGSAHLFYYKNFGGGGANRADLWQATAAANSGPGPGAGFAAGAQFDLGVGNGSGVLAIDALGDVIEPILAYAGNVAALAFIKTDGICRRLFVFKSTGGAFANIGTADIGGLNRDVYWGSVAINGSGQIAVAYAAMSPTDGFEHVYGNYYQGGVWLGATQLDSPSFSVPNLGFTLGMSPSGPPAKSMPNVSIDVLGNAMATFSMNDIFFAGRRRVIAVPFF